MWVSKAIFWNYRFEVVGSGKPSLDIYLDEPFIDMFVYKNLNVLTYQRIKSICFK